MYSFSLLSGISFDHISDETGNILLQQSVAENSKEVLRDIFSYMDFTSLDGADNQATIQQLCKKAISYGEQGLPYPAAVCIYPPFIAVARQTLKGTPIRVATTAAAFPSGQMALSVKLDEIRYAISEGADEIDVVISRGTFLAREYHKLFRELDAMREVAVNQTLKVILETGELKTAENIARASEIAIEAGADFIKTSTGKISPAATEESVYVMLQVIKEYHRKTGKRIGIKPAGGISEPEKALGYYRLVNHVLGESWLNPGLFRIGASRLADSIVEYLSPKHL
jgi:deoxyribose-phosphate aldolase